MIEITQQAFDELQKQFGLGICEKCKTKHFTDVEANETQTCRICNQKSVKKPTELLEEKKIVLL
jgi:hypothetical protein